VPLLLAAIVFGLMWTWHRGVMAVASALRVKTIPIADFIRDIAERDIPRVPGTAVFLTRTTDGTPPVLLWHVKNNRALHKFIVAFNLQVKPIPWVDPDNRLSVEKLGENFWRITVRYGFMERPDLPAAIAEAEQYHYCTLELKDVTYYVGHETVRHRLDGHGLPLWLERLFAFMVRNSAHQVGFFNLPNDCVVEIGRQIEI
jgi:KUP system potassium uptake protein